MNVAIRRLESARLARADAWEKFEVQLAEVQDDLAARGLGGRIADRVGNGARDTFDHALEVADENPGVIAGTVVALLLWLLRNPLIEMIQGWFGDNKEASDDDE